MTSLNRVTLIGRVTQEPKKHTFANGSCVSSFSLATSDKWKDKTSNEWKEQTEFHNINVVNEILAKFVDTYLKKGDLILVEGDLTYRKYTKKDGTEASTTEVRLKPFSGKIQILVKKDANSSIIQNDSSSKKRYSEDLDDDILF